MRPSHISTLSILAVCALFSSTNAYAQREYVEEVDPQKKTSLDNVDLDAPDPASKKPTKDPKATDPKSTKTTSDAKATDPKSTKTPAPDPKATDPRATATDPKATTTATDPKATGATTDPKATATDPKAADVADGASVEILQTTHDAYLEKWDARALTVRQNEVAKAKKQLPEIDTALLDFGVQGISGGFQANAAATALLREGRRALDDGNLEEAQAIVDVAEHAAPDLAAVHAQAALLKWKNGDLGGTINGIVEYVKAELRDPVAFSALASRALALGVIVVVLALVFFALLAGVPALRYLSFDLLQALPKGAHGGQVLALVVLLALAPLVVGAGPIFGALWILVLAFMYVSARERVVVGVLALACLAVPFAIDWGARFVAFPGSRSDRELRALFDADSENVRRDLAARKPGDLDVIEQAALAMQAKREGRVQDAVARWTEIVTKHADLGWAHGNLGVAYSLAGNEDQALAELGKAVTTNPHEYAASFDISIIHYRASRTDKATSAVAPVAKEAPLLLNAYRRTTFRQPDQLVGQNRAMVDIYPSPSSLLVDTIATPSSEAQAVSDTVTRTILRGQSGTRALAMLAAAPVLFLVLTFARKKLGVAQPCVRCGDPASKRVDKDAPEDTCGQCFHAFVSTRSRIDAGVKLRKEREIMRRRTRKGRIVLALGVLFPGLGHIYGGAPVLGAVFAVLHTAGVACLALTYGVLPMPRLEGPWSNTPLLAVVGAVVAIVWAIAARAAWVLAEDASGRGRR